MAVPTPPPGRYKAKPFDLVLDVTALTRDPLWLRLDPEGRGVLISLWTACIKYGSIPADPVAAARVSFLDAEPVTVWWDTLRPWFVPHPTLDLLIAPIFAKGIAAQEKRRAAASKGGHASVAVRRRGPSPILKPISPEEAAERLRALQITFQRSKVRVERAARKYTGLTDDQKSQETGTLDEPVKIPHEGPPTRTPRPKWHAPETPEKEPHE